MDRTILHCDMNSFYCSVELLERPELRDLPVAVAGDPASRRGIILAKNEAAKRFGVRTPEPVAQALKKCPELQLLPPHHDKYEDYFHIINGIYREYTDLVEPFSIDESWLDVTGSMRLFGSGLQIAGQLRRRIREELGLTLSIGVSWNKTFAKMGSEYKKPDATTEINRDNYKALLWPLPASHFFFVGRSTAARLAEFGIKTVGDIANSDPEALSSLLGVHGTNLYKAVNGLDDSPVRRWNDKEAAKSLGHGMTFPRDISGINDISFALTELSEMVGARLRHYGMKARGVKVEITTPDFSKKSKQKKLQTPVASAAAIKKESLALIAEMGYMNKPIRLITVTAINLVGSEASEQMTIFDFNETPADEALERTVDEIRKKFGEASISYAHKLKNDLGIGNKEIK